MRLGEAVATDKYMAAADDVFQLLNVIANVLVVVRPLCHLPVMVVYDRRLRASALRAHATLAAAVLSRLKREESDYSFDDVELDSIVAEDRQVLDDVDHLATTLFTSEPSLSSTFHSPHDSMRLLDENEQKFLLARCSA